MRPASERVTQVQPAPPENVTKHARGEQIFRSHGSIVPSRESPGGFGPIIDAPFRREIKETTMRSIGRSTDGTARGKISNAIPLSRIEAPRNNKRAIPSASTKYTRRPTSRSAIESTARSRSPFDSMSIPIDLNELSSRFNLSFSSFQKSKSKLNRD